MTNNTEFTWAPLIPLIGGFPLGTEQAFGKSPVAIYSFDGISNDLHYINYQNNTKGKNLELQNQVKAKLNQARAESQANLQVRR